MKINNLHIFWDSVAHCYPDEMSLFYSLKKEFDRSFVRKPNPHEGKRLLDAGSGKGYDLVYFADLGFDVVGLDFSERMCHLTRQYIAHTGCKEKIIVRCEDLRDIQYEDNSFDVVTCFSVIDHLPDITQRAKIVQELARVAKPGAQIIVTVPNIRSIIGFIINGGTGEAMSRHDIQITPHFFRGDEYTVITHMNGPAEPKRVQYQWEHYFGEDELSNLVSAARLDVAQPTTGVLLDPDIVFDDKQLISKLRAVHRRDEGSRRSVLYIRVFSSETENEIKTQIAQWQTLPRTHRGFRLAVVGEKEK